EFTFQPDDTLSYAPGYGLYGNLLLVRMVVALPAEAPIPEPPFNEPPKASAGPEEVGNKGKAITFQATASDPNDTNGATDITKVEWASNFNGSFNPRLTPPGSSTAELAAALAPTRTFTETGNFTVAIRVTDSAGHVTDPSATFVTVLDTDEAFVHAGKDM